MRTPFYRFYSSWERRLEIAYSIAAGLEFMHFNGIVHRYDLSLQLSAIPSEFI